MKRKPKECDHDFQTSPFLGSSIAPVLQCTKCMFVQPGQTIAKTKLILQSEYDRLAAENEKLREALTAIVNGIGPQDADERSVGKTFGSKMQMLYRQAREALSK